MFRSVISLSINPAMQKPQTSTYELCSIFQKNQPQKTFKQEHQHYPNNKLKQIIKNQNLKDGTNTKQIFKISCNIWWTNRNYLKFLNSGHKHLSTVPHLLSQRKTRKQPPEVFCKKTCSQKCCKIHRKTTVLETLF